MSSYAPHIPIRIGTGLKSVDRALTSLELLCTKGEIGISQLARAQGITTSTAHRILSTLVAHGLAVKNQQSNKYVTGQKLCTLTSISLETISALKWVDPYLQEMKKKTGETALFSVFSESDTSMVIVAQAISPRPLHVRCHLLRRVPVHVTAFGNAYLMSLTQEMLDYILKHYRFRKFTASTATSRNKLKTLITKFKNIGYASCRDDLFLGILSIAAPVMNCLKQFAGSLGLICPADRVDRDKEIKMGKMIVSAARRLSNQLATNGII